MDVGALATALRRANGAVDPRASAVRIAAGLHVLIPVVESSGAQPELARALRYASARAADATLILPAGSGQARVEIGNRQFVIPSALRDAILSALERAVPRAGATPAAAARAPDVRAGAHESASSQPAGRFAGADNRTAAILLPEERQPLSAAVAAQTRAAFSDAPGRPIVEAPRTARIPESTEPPPRTAGETPAPLASVAATSQRAAPRVAQVSFDAPLLDTDGATAAAADRLRSSVADSGLFFESHLAAWSKGARALDTLRDELRQVSLLDPAAHEAADRSAPAAVHALPLTARAGAQLDVLARDAVQLHGPAWPGQPVTIELRRQAPASEFEAERDADGSRIAAVFGAVLRLEVPQLGAMTVHLRLAGSTIAARVATAVPERIAPALPQLASRLQARGLQPVALHAIALDGATAQRPADPS